MKDAHPETAVNILKANMVLSLDAEDEAEWDIVSATPPPQTNLDLSREKLFPRPKDQNISSKIRQVSILFIKILNFLGGSILYFGIKNRRRLDKAISPILLKTVGSFLCHRH